MRSLNRLLITICLAGTGLLSCSKSVTNGNEKNISATGSRTKSNAFSNLTVAIPMGGNSYITNGISGATIYDRSNYGLHEWTNLLAVISTYFKVADTGTLYLGFKGSVPGGHSTVRLTVNNHSFDVNITGASSQTYYAGSVNIITPGYVKVDIRGIGKFGGTYIGDLTDIMIGGPAAGTGLIYASNSDNFYWSRRGPSVHLNYSLPDGPSYEYEWVYNEVTVPAGQDAIGSFYMSNGFNGGYFGIQVVSATQKRVLFSVWDPGDLSNGYTTLISKGDGVVDSSFGGEGTGRQSYLVYNWVSGNTYKFLTRIRPDDAGNTLYSSWFYTPEAGTWKYIATFKRPLTTSYISEPYSFLENFNNTQGYIGRKAYYGNIWARTKSGDWVEAVSAEFTVDATGGLNQRKDYKGGVENGKFFLQNCGFFNDFLQTNTTLTRPATGSPPNVDLNNLPST